MDQNNNVTTKVEQKRTTEDLRPSKHRKKNWHQLEDEQLQIFQLDEEQAKYGHDYFESQKKIGIVVNVEKTSQIFKAAEIMQVRLVQKKIIIGVINNQIESIGKSITYYEEKLCNSGFIRVNPTTLINIRFIEKIDWKASQLFIQNEEKVKISRRKLNPLRTIINKHFI